jgi:polysaccharide export outer membrane protein
MNKNTNLIKIMSNQEVMEKKNMIQKYFKISKPTIIILFGIIFFQMTSCVTQSDLEYLNAKDKSIKTYKEADIADYKLKPNDELYIQINSLDEAATNVFSNSGSQREFNAGSLQPYGASLVSYTINKEGYLQLPIIGNIIVKDKTLSEVSQLIQDSLANILSQPIVSVKLVNRYISVLGEVRSPGHFPYAQEKLTVYDAIGFAGDMTIYSNRKEVILARNENGKNIIITIDLTRPEILESNYYYLRPNDMVYVKPLKKRIWGLDQFPYALILSTISTALLLYTVVK